jgi:very-short-patch-repair endonuclease
MSTGMTSDQIRQKVRSGFWHAHSPGTYIVAGTVDTWEQRTMASVAAAGPLAVCSHLSAAWLHRLIEKRPGRIDVTVPHGRHRGSVPGVVLHKARLQRSDIRRIDGIPVTGPGRTLVDVAALLDDRRLAAALDTALLRGLVSIPALRRYIDERGLGRNRGVGRLMRLLDDRELGVPESELERRFLAVAKRFRLAAPARQAPVGPYRVDFAYPEKRLLIELDGRATHGTAEAFEADPIRQNALVLDGWVVLRFTWKQLRERPSYVVETIERALSRRS